MTEVEVQKILMRIAHEYHLQHSRAVKLGIQRVRTKSGAVIAYEFESNGSYVRLGRISNEKTTV